MKKIFIKNRQQQNLSVIIENELGIGWLVFVMHWLWDSKDSLHITQYSEAFLSHDFVLVRFDTTNTFGESDWQFENATLTNYFEDLEDVIKWASNENFYKENFILLWHSLWAISCALYAQKNNKKVVSLIVISTPINYALSASTYSTEELDKWQNSGFLIENWDGFIVKLKRNYMEDKKQYDLLKNTEKFTMPVLMIAWENDQVTPCVHQKKLFAMIHWEKKLCIIKNWPHTFREQNNLDEIKAILNSWIELIVTK